MTDQFELCLSVTLNRETSYPQPTGGPYQRLKGGFVYDALAGDLVNPAGARAPVPAKHDGLAYDDHPKDPGGRTCMGIRQDEYSKFRKNTGNPDQDVWRISDEELRAIYFAQYWNVLRCQELPPGVSLSVFDMGVLCGVGKSARFIQQAAEVAVDGHIGEFTIAAVAERNPRDVISAFTASRVTYLRACRNFATFGDGWLQRANEVGRISQAIAAATSIDAIEAEHLSEIQAFATTVHPDVIEAAEILTPVDDLVAGTAKPPKPAPPPSTMAVSPVGNASLAGGGFSLWQSYVSAKALVLGIIQHGVESFAMAGKLIFTNAVLFSQANDLIIALGGVATATFVWLRIRYNNRNLA